MLEDIMFGVLLELVDMPENNTGARTGSTIDLKGFEGCKVGVIFGDSQDTLAVGLYWTCKLQEAEIIGTWTDVAAADVIGNTSNQFGLVNAPTEDQAVYSLGYKGKKRYLRAVVTDTGSHSSGTIIAIVAIKWPVDRPVSQAVNPS